MFMANGQSMIERQPNDLKKQKNSELQTHYIKLETHQRKGQIMIFTAIVFIGAITIIGVFVGLLVRFGFAQSTNIPLSSESIFAADAGIECVINKRFGIIEGSNCPEAETIKTLGNGSRFQYRQLYDNNTWVAIGMDRKGRTVRALQIRFVEVR